MHFVESDIMQLFALVTQDSEVILLSNVTDIKVQGVLNPSICSRT